MRIPTLAIASFLASACFQPSDGTTPVRCDAQNTCPDGQVCQAGLCTADIDLGQAVADMAAVASVGCANAAKSQKLTDRVFACAGGFGVGEARKLCAGGWAICQDMLDLSQSACEALRPFFIADVPAYRPSVQVFCGATTLYQRMFGGCGSVPPFNGLVLDTSCTKFRIFAVDKSEGYDFSSGHSLDKAISTDSAKGVLCCR